MFVESIFSVHVRVAEKLFGFDERRSVTQFLMIVVVWRPRIVPRVQAVLGRRVETDVVQLQKVIFRLETDRGHGVVFVTLVVGHPQFRFRHRGAFELLVFVRFTPIPQRVLPHTGDNRLGTVVGQRVESDARAGQLKALHVLDDQLPFAVRINYADLTAVRREGYGHFGSIVRSRPQGTLGFLVVFDGRT